MLGALSLAACTPTATLRPAITAADSPPRQVLLYRDTLTVTRVDGSLCAGPARRAPATGWSGTMGGCENPPGFTVAPGAAPRRQPRLALARVDTPSGDQPPVRITLPGGSSLDYAPARAR